MLRVFELSVSLLFIFLFSCHVKKDANIADKNSSNEVIASDRNFEAEEFSQATVKDMSEIAGCTFLLELENGRMLQPDKLPENFRKNDLPVWIKYVIDKNQNSFCMSGKLIVLSEIEFRQ
jgi:hypothetical protein